MKVGAKYEEVEAAEADRKIAKMAADEWTHTDVITGTLGQMGTGLTLIKSHVYVQMDQVLSAENGAQAVKGVH